MQRSEKEGKRTAEKESESEPVCVAVATEVFLF